MDQFGEWVYRGVTAALIAAFAALFARQRNTEKMQGRLDERVQALKERMDSDETGDTGDLAERMHKLELAVERNFVRREEWVPHISRILGALEAQGKQLARIDERNRVKDAGN